MKLALIAALSFLSSTVRVARAEPPDPLIVICAPGSPGTTAEAQPVVDAFAAVASHKAGVPLQAVYDESEDGGVKRLQKASIAVVSLPFFLKHEHELGLHPRLEAVQQGHEALEHWTLVAEKGRVTSAAALDGFTIVSNAAFAPAFVRGAVLAFGRVPASTKLVQSSAVLSALHRASAGERVAVLLDATQAASLSSLPFADKLEVIARSPALPTGIVATIDARMPAKLWKQVESALLALGADSAGASALASIQMTGFVPLDEKILAAARKDFADAQK